MAWKFPEEETMTNESLVHLGERPCYSVLPSPKRSAKDVASGEDATEHEFHGWAVAAPPPA
jgi:hypothetical protein